MACHERWAEPREPGSRRLQVRYKVKEYIRSLGVPDSNTYGQSAMIRAQSLIEDRMDEQFGRSERGS